MKSSDEAVLPVFIFDVHDEVNNSHSSRFQLNSRETRKNPPSNQETKYQVLSNKNVSFSLR